MLKSRTVFLIVLAFALLTLAACGIEGSGFLATPTAVPPLEVQVPATPAEEPTLAPPTVTATPDLEEVLTPGPDETPTSEPTPTAEIAPQAELSSAPDTWEALEAWLAAAWANGHDPDAVAGALQDAGWQREDVALQAADLTGDGEPEWVVPLAAGPRFDAEVPLMAFGEPGTLWIVGDGGVVYRHHDGADALGREPGMLPDVVALEDLTGDGLPDLITQDTECGAHTCFGYFQVIGVVDGEFANLVRSADPAYDMIIMSYPELRIEPYEGQPAIWVHGGSIGSVGAGIVRSYTEVWAWDGEAITWQETILDPTTYRHHILYEGIERMDAGDLDEAEALFEQAIHDPDLETVGFLEEDPTDAEILIEHFAAFRLILIHLLQGDEEAAADRLAWMSDEPPAAPLTEAAGELVAEWTGPEDAEALCADIQLMLEADEEPLGPLAYQGYGNPLLAAEDVCRVPSDMAGADDAD